MKFLNCKVDNDYSILVKKDFDTSALSFKFILDEDKKQGRLGKLDIMVGDTLIGSTPVTYDTETDAAKAYSGGKSIDDDMTVAEVNKKQLTPHKVMKYMIRIIIAVILIFLIMQIIRHVLAERKRRMRIQQRNKRRLKSTSTRPQSAAGTDTPKKSSSGVSSSSKPSPSQSSSPSSGSRPRRRRSEKNNNSR